MTNKTHYDFYNKILHKTFCSAIFVFIAYGVIPATGAIVDRTTPAATTATTPRPASQRMPTMSTKISSTSLSNSDSNTNNNSDNNNDNSGTTTNTNTNTSTQPDVIIEDKTSQFDSVLETSTTGTVDASTQSLADLIRAQRAALDAATAEEFSAKNTQAVTAGLSSCDSGLRTCMKEKCGSDFLKCSGDGDTIWGDKMDACRRNVTCSGEEYRLFSIEIKADRDLNAKMSGYQKILDCGNSYNSCIETQCGATFNKCLGKAAGDAAIAKCASIARDCTQQDSGLAARAMEVFATLRQDAEKQIKKDEARLYELRDTMRNRCQSLGALFDDRSLDCVFTVEFWAGQPTTSLYASKKAYAGSTFDCTQNWFGVDITTFKENAYRETRSQTSASSAMMGAGIGTAVGAVTSGAVNRAIDRHKAEQAVKKAEKQRKEADNAGASNSSTDTESKPNETKTRNTTIAGKELVQNVAKNFTTPPNNNTSDNNTPSIQTAPAPISTDIQGQASGTAKQNESNTATTGNGVPGTDATNRVNAPGTAAELSGQGKTSNNTESTAESKKKNMIA